MADDVVVKITAQMDELRADLGRVKDLLGDLKKQGEDSLETQRADAFRDKMTAIADAAGAIGDKFSALSSHFLNAADQVDALGDKLSATFDPEQVGPMVDAIRELGATPPFSAEQFADAIQSLQKFNVEGLASVDNLRRIGDVAAKTGGSFEGLTQNWGLLSRGGDEAKRAVQALSKEFGITGTELAAFGAKVDLNGQLLVKTPAQAAAARKALEALADSEKFAGSMDKMAGGLEKFQGQLGLLSQDAGKPILEFMDGLAGSAAEVLESLRKTNPELAGFVGGTSAVVGALGSVGSSALETGAQLGMLATGLPALKTAAVGAATAAKTAFTAVAGAIGVTTIAFVALAAAVHLTTVEMEKANKAAEDLLKTEERRAKALRESKDLIGKSADELQRMGVKSKDLVDVLGGLQDQIEAARAAGNQPLVAKLEEQARALGLVKSELAALEGAAKQSAEAQADAHAEAADRAVEAWENFKKRASAGWFPNKREELKAFDEVAAGLQRGTKEFEEAKLERVRLAREAAKEEAEAGKHATEEAKKQASERLKSSLHAIELGAAAHRLSKRQEVAELQQVLATHQMTAEERRGIESKIAALEGQLQEDSKKRAEELLKKRVQNIELERAKLAEVRDLTTADEIAFQERIVRLHKKGTQERAAAEEQLAGLKAKLRQEEEAAQKRLSDLDAQLKNARIAEIEDEISVLEDRISKEEAAGRSAADLQRKVLELMKERKRVQQDLIALELQGQLKDEKDPRVRAKMEEVAAKQTADAARDADREIRTYQEGQTKRALDLVDANKKAGDSFRGVGDEAKKAGDSVIKSFEQIQEELRQQFEVKTTPFGKVPEGFGESAKPSTSSGSAPVETKKEARERAERTKKEREEQIQRQKDERAEALRKQLEDADRPVERPPGTVPWRDEKAPAAPGASSSSDDKGRAGTTATLPPGQTAPATTPTGAAGAGSDLTAAVFQAGVASIVSAVQGLGGKLGQSSRSNVTQGPATRGREASEENQLKGGGT